MANEKSASLKKNHASVDSKAAPFKAAVPSGDKLEAKEINGPKGLEPTRYGDWESKGRCHDF